MTDAELTRLAAEKVMGFKEVCDEPLKYAGQWIAADGSTRELDWSPLTDWSAAGEIVEKMRADGWFPGVQSGPKLIDGKWARVVRVRWGKEKKFGTFTSADFPRAITIAALLAVGAITEGQV